MCENCRANTDVYLTLMICAGEHIAERYYCVKCITAMKGGPENWMCVYELICELHIEEWAVLRPDYHSKRTGPWWTSWTRSTPA